MNTALAPQSLGTSRDSRILQYGVWQFRDYFMNRGSLTFVLCAALGYGQSFQMMQMVEYRANSLNAQALLKYGGSVSTAKEAMRHDAVQGFLTTFIGIVVFLGALIAINGFAAGDRKAGFYRFLFAKPLAPVRYYAQQFVIHLTGFLVVLALLGLLFGAVVAPVLTVKLFGAAALMFFFYSAIGFLLSAATPVDWLPLVALSVLSQLIWDNYNDSPKLLAKLRYLLPPLTRTGEIYGAFVRGTDVPWKLVWWFAGYGAVCLALGLVVIRRRRLAVS